MLEAPPQERLDALAHTYAQAVSAALFEEGCGRVDKVALADMFAATAIMAFYYRTPAWVSKVECLHGALEEHDLATADHHRRLHGLMIAVRRFDEANELRRRHAIQTPNLPRLPPSTEKGLSVIRLAEEGRLEHRALLSSSDSGVQVIALVHPYCGFSKRALDTILVDARYSWLRPHLQLVVPREPDWPESAMRDWNAAHPGHPMYAQSANSEWEMLGALETPVFHLVKNGRVILTVTGWNGDENTMKKLEQRIAREPAPD